MLRKPLFSKLAKVSLVEQIDAQDWDDLNRIIFNFATHLDIPVQLARNCTRLSDILSVTFNGNETLVSLLNSGQTSLEQKIINEVANITNINCCKTGNCFVFVNHSVITNLMKTWHNVCLQNPNSFLNLFIHFAYTVSQSETHPYVANKTTQTKLETPGTIDDGDCLPKTSTILLKTSDKEFEHKIQSIVDGYIDSVDTKLEDSLTNAIRTFNIAHSLNYRRCKSERNFHLQSIRKLEKNILLKVEALKKLYQSKHDNAFDVLNSKFEKLLNLLSKTRCIGDLCEKSRRGDSDDDDDNTSHRKTLQKITNQLNIIGKSIKQDLSKIEDENKFKANHIIEDIVMALPDVRENEPMLLEQTQNVGIAEFLSTEAFTKENLLQYGEQLQIVYDSTINDIAVQESNVENKDLSFAIVSFNICKLIFRLNGNDSVNIGSMLAIIYAAYDFIRERDYSTTMRETDIDSAFTSIKMRMKTVENENEQWQSENIRLRNTVEENTRKHSEQLTASNVLVEKLLLEIEKLKETIANQASERIQTESEAKLNNGETPANELEDSSRKTNDGVRNDSNSSVNKVSEDKDKELRLRTEAIENNIAELKRENISLSEKVVEYKCLNERLQLDGEEISNQLKRAVDAETDLKLQLYREINNNRKTKLLLQSENRMKRLAIKRLEKIWHKLIKRPNTQNDAKNRLASKLLKLKHETNIRLEKTTTEESFADTSKTVSLQEKAVDSANNFDNVEKYSEKMLGNKQPQQNERKSIELSNETMSINLKRKHHDTLNDGEHTVHNFLQLLSHENKETLTKDQVRFAINAIAKLQEEVNNHRKDISDSNSVNDVESPFYAKNKSAVETFIEKMQPPKDDESLSWIKLLQFLGAKSSLDESDIELYKFFNKEVSHFQGASSKKSRQKRTTALVLS